MAFLFGSRDPAAQKAHHRCTQEGCDCAQFIPALLNAASESHAANPKLQGSCLSCRHATDDHALTDDFPLKKASPGESFSAGQSSVRLRTHAKFYLTLYQNWTGSPAKDTDTRVVSTALLEVHRRTTLSRDGRPWEHVVESIRQTKADFFERHEPEETLKFAREWCEAVTEAGLNGCPPSIHAHWLFLSRRILSSLRDATSSPGDLDDVDSVLLADSALVLETAVSQLIDDVAPGRQTRTFDSLCFDMSQNPENLSGKTVNDLKTGVASVCADLLASTDRFLRASEIQFTENSYVRKLQHLLQCCEAAQEPVPHLAAIYGTHTKIAGRMNQVMETWSSRHSRFATVLPAEDLGAMKPFYNDFLIWQDSCLQAQTAWFQASATAQSLASTVATRILRYELLFAELIKNTHADHEDLAPLKKVLEDIHSMMRHTNDYCLRSKVAVAISRAAQLRPQRAAADSTPGSRHDGVVVQLVGEIEPLQWPSAEDGGHEADKFQHVLCLTISSLVVCRAKKLALGQERVFEVIIDLMLPDGIDADLISVEDDILSLAARPADESSFVVEDCLASSVLRMRTNIAALWEKTIRASYHSAGERRREAQRREEETFGAAAQARNSQRNLAYMKSLLR